MTLNLLWSDQGNAYLLTDTARSHRAMPKHSHSLLGQAQRIEERGLSVEEGAQKIIELGGGAVAALCGDELEATGLAASFREAFREGDLSIVMERVMAMSQSCGVEVTVAVPGVEPPFTVIRHPERELLEVQRGHIHMTGSLDGEAKSFIWKAVERFLVQSAPPIAAEVKLVCGLACATAAAVHYHLPDHGVGGAFFGGWLDHELFHWQPDIVYVFYDADFADGLPVTSDWDGPIEESGRVRGSQDGRVDFAACRVRDGVFVSLSTIGMRGNVAWSDATMKDLGAWMRAWAEQVQAMRFFSPAYYVFVPRSAGRVVVVVNDGEFIRENAERISFSSVLAELLTTPVPERKFDLKVLSRDLTGSSASASGAAP